ncbi:hypothetical protein EJ08DRAFT_684319 [Tothia fuscella]|uniref:Uncharacterized protein n=1 Tax=Tothia fuscella TaxID=1048955 RepID=A0A9P4TSI4_9PEZI|nr:hypothetical protein EJ08DRAFT_684319 [Tothia fuscella]
MRFTKIIPCCLIGTSLASPLLLSRAPGPPVEQAIRGVGEQFEALDAHFTSANAKNAWPSNAAALTQQAQSIQDRIIDKLISGRLLIRSGPNIDGQESMRLWDWSEALTKYYEKTIPEWSKARKHVQAVGKNIAVLRQLNELMINSENFNADIAKKMVGPAAVAVKPPNKDLSWHGFRVEMAVSAAFTFNSTDREPRFSLGHEQRCGNSLHMTRTYNSSG